MTQLSIGSAVAFVGLRGVDAQNHWGRGLVHRYYYMDKSNEIIYPVCPNV